MRRGQSQGLARETAQPPPDAVLEAPSSPTLSGLLCLGVALIAMLAPQALASDDAGTVRLTRPAESDFDRHTLAPNPAQQAFMAEHFWRMRTYAPYFDERLSWFPNAWTYRDLYAIYRDDDLASSIRWILRDASGDPLYIPFDCDGGSCTQYAGDIGNPHFRAHWIAEAKQQAARYRGIFVDDVNLEFRVSNGAGEDVVPETRAPARRCAKRTGAATWPSSPSRCAPPCRTRRSFTTRSGSPAPAIRSCAVRSTPPPTWSWSVA